MKRTATILLFLCFVCGLVFGAMGHFVLKAWGQEIHHHPGATELIDKFYSTWKMPIIHPACKQKDCARRVALCCNRKDCAVREVSLKDGQWNVHFIDVSHDVWIPIPANIIEANQPDPRESPDGQTHVCIDPNSLQILCAVLGAGQ